MSSDIYFDSEEFWSASGGMVDLVLEAIAAAVTSTSLSDELLSIVQNNLGGILLTQLTVSDQLEFLHAITSKLRDNVLAQIPADNPFLDRTSAHLDDLVAKAQNQLRLRASEA